MVDITTTDKTNTHIFLLPVLYDKLLPEHLTYINKYITNSYIGIKNKPEYNNTLVLLFNEVDITIYLILKDILHKYSIYSVYTSNKAIFSLNSALLPLEWYNPFKDGKYSAISPYFKLLICKYWLLTPDSYIYSILFKTELIQTWWVDKGFYNPRLISESAEYWIKPNLQTELLTL
jgi:hypothetical protein